MNFVFGMLKAPIKWRVVLKRKATTMTAGQAARRKVHEVIADDRYLAGLRALEMYDNGKYFDVESVREVR